MQDDNQPSQPTPQPVDSRPSLESSHRVIQPVNDMSQYVTKPAEPAPPAPAQQPPQNPPAEPAHALGNPVDVSKIYPNVAPRPAPNAIPVPEQKSAAANKQRMARRVPSLQVYAFLIIIYALYNSFTIFYIFSTNKSTLAPGSTGVYTHVSPVEFMLAGEYAINILVGIYLLVAKNVRVVNSLLTALLIIGGLDLLNSIVTTVQLISHITVSRAVYLLISAGLLAYLWNVKSDVDLLTMD